MYKLHKKAKDIHILYFVVSCFRSPYATSSLTIASHMLSTDSDGQNVYSIKDSRHVLGSLWKPQIRSRRIRVVRNL